MDPRELLPGPGEAPSSNPEEWECNSYGVHHAKVAYNITESAIMSATNDGMAVDLQKLGLDRCRRFATETVAKVLATIAGGPPFAIRLSEPTTRAIYGLIVGKMFVIEITIFAWNLQDMIKGLDFLVDPPHFIGTSAPNIAFFPMAQEFIQKNMGGGMYVEVPRAPAPVHYEGRHVDKVWTDEIGPERSLPKGG